MAQDRTAFHTRDRPEETTLKEAFDKPTYPTMPAIDFEAYLPYLEDEDIPEDQKRELIETLFNIMMGFADIAFGLSPSQNICGKLLEIDSDSQTAADTVVQLEDQNTTEQFKSAAKGDVHESI